MQLSTGIETQKERTLAMLEDKEFMCWLFERYGRFIWYTVKKFCRRTDLWEDIVQESLLRLLSCTPRLRNLSEQKLTGYIAVTTRNTTYALLWKEEKNRENCISLESIDIAEDGLGLEEIILQKERIEQLAKACLGLPDEVYYLLTSYYILGYRTEEMAEELGCPPNHVRMKMTRARRQVRKRIQEQNKEGIL